MKTLRSPRPFHQGLLYYFFEIKFNAVLIYFLFEKKKKLYFYLKNISFSVCHTYYMYFEQDTSLFLPFVSQSRIFWISLVYGLWAPTGDKCWANFLVYRSRYTARSDVQLWHQRDFSLHILKWFPWACLEFSQNYKFI